MSKAWYNCTSIHWVLEYIVQKSTTFQGPIFRVLHFASTTQIYQPLRKALEMCKGGTYKVQLHWGLFNPFLLLCFILHLSSAKAKVTSFIFSVYSWAQCIVPWFFMTLDVALRRMRGHLDNILIPPPQALLYTLSYDSQHHPEYYL